MRGEVFGSAGAATAGGSAASSFQSFDAAGAHAPTVRSDVELFADAYTAELAEFASAVAQGRQPSVTGRDARRALSVALSCIESVKTGGPVDPASLETSAGAGA